MRGVTIGLCREDFFRSTCLGSLWMPGCGSSSPRRARCVTQPID